MPEDIPPLLRPDDTPPIRSVSDLDRFWRSIKGPWGFSQPQLWCALFGPGGELTPMVVKIEDCPDVPDPEMLGGLFGILTTAIDESVTDGSVAIMFARPGGDESRADDRAWARQLSEAGQRASIDVWPVFLANDARVRVAAPDDLAA